MAAPSPGTIDVTDLVESLRQAWVSWGVAFIFGTEAALPGMSWLALPIVSDVDQAAIKAILDAISKASIMEAFFVNTAVRKASQAKDFTDVVAAKNALPPTASPAEYEAAENAQMLAFRNFVLVSN